MPFNTPVDEYNRGQILLRGHLSASRINFINQSGEEVKDQKKIKNKEEHII